MKKVILSAVAVVFAISSFAQGEGKMKKTPEEVATKKADKLKTELALSDEQRAKAYAIFFDNVTKIRAVKAKYPNDDKSARGEIKPLKESCDASIKAILTPEQVTKWEAMKKEHKKEHKEKKKRKKKVD